MGEAWTWCCKESASGSLSKQIHWPQKLSSVFTTVGAAQGKDAAKKTVYRRQGEISDWLSIRDRKVQEAKVLSSKNGMVLFQVDVRELSPIDVIMYDS